VDFNVWTILANGCPALPKIKHRFSVGYSLNNSMVL
jgi:hypothetical protein